MGIFAIVAQTDWQDFDSQLSIYILFICFLIGKMEGMGLTDL